MRVVAGAGLSWFRVTQTFVTGIEYHEDTAAAPTTVTVTRVGHASEPGSGVGLNGTVDVIWTLNETIGIGALARYSRGTASFSVGSRTAEASAGGLHAGVGIRFLF